MRGSAAHHAEQRIEHVRRQRGHLAAVQRDVEGQYAAVAQRIEAWRSGFPRRVRRRA